MENDRKHFIGYFWKPKHVTNDSRELSIKAGAARRQQNANQITTKEGANIVNYTSVNTLLI